MPFKEIDPEMWKRLFRRVLLVGLPNTWKTSTIVKTFPRPLVNIACPGELGSASIPAGLADVQGYTFERAEGDSPAKTVAEMTKLCTSIIISGKYQTLAIEGLHKLYEVIYEMEHIEVTTAYPTLDPEKAKWQTFGRAQNKMLKFIQSINSSTMPYVAMSVWAAPQADEALDKSGGATQHWMPALPGRTLPSLVTGEFGVVVNCKPGAEVAPGRFGPGKWEVRPRAYSRGASLKVPPEVAAKIPTEVEADWGKLEAMVMGEK